MEPIPPTCIPISDFNQQTLMRHGALVANCAKELNWFSSVSVLDRPGGLRALAEMLLVPAGGDVWLGAAGALKTAKITSLSNE